MLVSLIKKFFRDKKSATAVAMALMTVPLLISASAAVDFSRIASARTLLQGAIDGAAIAGAGEWQMSESSTNAYNTAQNEFSNSGAQLPKFVSIGTPTIALACTGTTGTGNQTTNQCGGTQSFSTTTVQGCPATFEYCVVVNATATLKNTLFASLIPSELLTVKSVGIANFPASNFSGKDIPPSPGFGSAGDISGIYAYAVPMDNPGNAPNYNEMPAANTYCANSTAPLQYENMVAPGTGVTACNYLFVANSLGTGGTGGSISLQQNQPIAFAFINFTGGNGYQQDDNTNYTTNLMISTTSSTSGYTAWPQGESVNTYTYTITTTTITCSAYPTKGNQENQCSSQTTKTGKAVNYSSGTEPTAGSSSTTCTQYYPSNKYNGDCETSSYTTTSSSTITTTALYGSCPDHTLYGSLSQGYGTPSSDSLNNYSSAYEVLGEPPTHNTNHVLTPFVTTTVVTNTVNGNSYYVKAACPNYSTSGTGIKAPVSSTYSSQTGNSVFAGMNTFSTWFPDQPFTDNAASDVITSGSGDVYPPVIGACTPATNATDGGITPVKSDPWWNWSGSNTGKCTQQQSASFSNCALLIQPLGTQVPVNSSNEAIMPDYYNEIEDSSGNVLALDPVYDGIPYTDLLTGVAVTNTDQAEVTNSSGDIITQGYTPTSSSSPEITSTTKISAHGTTAVFGAGSKFIGDYIVTQPPASRAGTLDHDLPQSTSSKCYNPSVATSVASGGVEIPGYNSNGFAVDPIANPQLGAVICNSPTPETYALYWNDMGTYESDDLGYWNAVQTFTCSVPASTNAGGGPATLSG